MRDEFTTLYLIPAMDEHLNDMAYMLEAMLGREVAVVLAREPALNIYTASPRIIAEAVDLIGRDNIEEVASP